KTTLSSWAAMQLRATLIETNWFFERQDGRDTQSMVNADLLDLEALEVRVRNALKRGPVLLDGTCALNTVGRLGRRPDAHVLVTALDPSIARLRCGSGSSDGRHAVSAGSP